MVLRFGQIYSDGSNRSGLMLVLVIVYAIQWLVAYGRSL